MHYHLNDLEYFYMSGLLLSIIGSRYFIKNWAVNLIVGAFSLAIGLSLGGLTTIQILPIPSIAVDIAWHNLVVELVWYFLLLTILPIAFSLMITKLYMTKCGDKA